MNNSGYSLPIYDQLTDAGFCGDDGNNVKYLLKNDGTLVIIGNGEMSDFTSNSGMRAPWINTAIKSVVIKNGVTSIGQWAFCECEKIERIAIPNSVTRIGIQAFYGCENLTSVAIPNSVNNIEDGAFSRCWNLASVNIPDSVTEIKSDLFQGCKFDSITIPNSVTSIENNAFAGTNLTEISIPDSVKSIKTAFRDCKNLSSVTIGKSLTSIFTDAFIGCTNLSSIKVAEGNPVYDSRNNCNAVVLTESNKLYIGCKSTIISNNITSIGDHAFYNCDSLLTITIPDSVKTINTEAFMWCDNLSSVTFGDSIEIIGSEAFRGCPNLKSISLPDSVTKIERYAFSNCTNLSIISIPDSVIDIGYCAFKSTAWLNNQPDGVVYAGKVAYAVKGDCPSDVILNQGTISIADEAFAGCKELTTLSIPDTVINIGMYAFRFCTGLSSVSFGDSVKFLGKESFRGCTNLKSVNIPNSVTKIEESAFSRCKEITEVALGNSVTYIGSGAFRYCPKLTRIIVPLSVCDIDNQAFGYNDYNEKTNDFTILGYSGTIAENYASENGFAFISIREVQPISNCQISINPSSFTYGGIAKQPSVTVKDDSTTLIEDTDYTVSYSNNTNAGTATVTIIGKGDYTGSTTKSFTINPKSISSATVTLSPISYTYDGAEKKPSVTVKDGTKTLTSGTDYSVSYSNNVDVGTATVTVTGKNNYTGSTSKTFTITEPAKVNISSCTITLSPTSYTYDGTAKQPSITVKYGSTTLTKDIDYTVSYSNNTNAGTATVTITGKGDYTGSTTKNFTINAKSISSATVTLSPTFYTYDGTEKKPSVTVKDDTKTLTSGTDYSVSYSNNVNVGTATVTVSGKENYTDSKTLEFIIRNNEEADDKNRLLGDADGDGKISISDATIIQKYIAEYPVTNKFTVAAADVNESGTITIIDATCIQKYLAEYTIPERIGYPISDIEQETTRLPATEPTTTTPVITEPPTEPATDQVIEYDNGDYVYVPSEDNLEFDTEEAALYYNNLLSVYLTEDISTTEEQRLANLCNGEVAGKISGVIHVLQIKVAPSSLSKLNAYSALLMKEPSVLYPTYEYPMEIDLNTDNNPWKYNGIKETDKGNEKNPSGNDWWAEAIGAYSAWKYNGCLEQIESIGIIDAGFDSTHEEFVDGQQSKMMILGDNTPSDHGEHVSGICAAYDNSVGIRGIADKSNLVCASIFEVKTKTQFDEYIRQMSNQGISVFNLSFGRSPLLTKKQFENNKKISSNFSDGYSGYLNYNFSKCKDSACTCINLLAQLIDSGCDPLIVQAAGNGYENAGEGYNAYYNSYFCAIEPASYAAFQSQGKIKTTKTYDEIKDHIIVVGAVDDVKSNRNYQLTNFSNFGTIVDLVAPGKSILSCVTKKDDNQSVKKGTIANANGLNYDKLDGTSMAAPMVTGSAALLKSVDLSLTSAEIKDILINKSAGKAIKRNSEDTRATYPMLNVGNAVEYVMSHRLHKRLVDDKPFMQKMVEMHFEGESISSAAELQQKISDNPYGTFYLTNDIEGDDEINNFWYTIPEFHGTLYGNGYTIKELSVIGGEAALFRNIENAEIRDLGFDSVAATALFANGTYAGIIAAFADSCIIENCYAVNSKVNSTYLAGAFTANAKNTKFINLYSNTAVSGLCGMGSNTDTDYVSGSIGGITGYYESRQPDSDSFVNCRVESDITAEVSSDNYIKSGSICVGGFVGELNATTGSPQRPMDSSDENIPPTPITFSKCQFNGEVQGYGGNSWYSEELSSGKTLYHTADVYSGGLIGNAKTDWGSGTGAWSGIVHVIDSSVTGTVIADTKGTACAGGVIGHAQVFTESGNGVLIRNTSFNGRVNAYYQEDDKCDIAYIGTMIGSNNFHCLLDSTKSSGTINAKSGWAIYAGKLIGDDTNSQTNISNATVNVAMNIDSDATDSWRHIGGNIGSV